MIVKLGILVTKIPTGKYEGAVAKKLKKRLNSGSALAIVIAACVILPILSISWMALSVDTSQWGHLLATVLPRYFTNSLLLMLGVGLASLCLGTSLAYVVTHLEFPGRKIVQYALFLPLAVPSFVAAYTWVDVLEYAGPLQTYLRDIAGWSSVRDYWFPNIRSLPGAVLVLSFTLYPYVYLLARAAFRELPASGQDVARSLGLGHARQFWNVSLPQARPAIAAGTAIVMMETLNDFGTVDYFAVQTLTTGIFSLWLESYNPGGAAQLALLAVAIVAILLWVEKIGRRRARFNRTGRQIARIQPQIPARGVRSLSLFFCVLPILIGFFIPLSVLVAPALRDISLWSGTGLWRAAGHSVLLGSISAILVVGISAAMVLGLNGARPAMRKALLTVTTLGYAFPGAVLGLGVLVPLALFDNWVADRIFDAFKVDPGLILTGSMAALVVAYVVRFFAIGVGATEAGLAAISPNIPLAAQSLGSTPRSLVLKIYQPLMRGSLASALVLVFVDTVKELPATLLLRPFNFETLSTRIYGQASLENFNAVAPAALLIVALSLGAIILLAKAHR